MNNSQEPGAVGNKAEEQCKVYGIRWAMLSIFVMYSASNAMQWIQYSIVAEVIVKFYGISYGTVDMTSMIYMILYIPFIFPGSYLLDKLGLRVPVLMGMVGTCLGSWLKVASVAPDRFWLGFFGHSIVALSQVFVLSVPARLAAVWFGPSQVSSACSIGVFGNQLGVAIGFVLPTMMVHADVDEARTQHDLYMMFMAVAIITTVLLVVIIFFFKAAPPTPPSPAQLQAQNEEHAESLTNFMQSIKRLCCNRSYMLLLVAYGINVGIFYAISTLLSQIIQKYYPGSLDDAGRIGLLIVLSGMVGSVACGVVLDKFHRYKETTLVVYSCCLVAMVVYTFSISQTLVAAYVVSTILGFFMTGLLPVGFELGAELTYPEPEGTSAGLLNAASQLFGIIFTYLYALLFRDLGDMWANAIMSAMLVVGTVFVALISPDLKRQAAHSTSMGSNCKINERF